MKNMKVLFPAVLFFLVLFGCGENSQKVKISIHSKEEILSQISEPQIPEYAVNLKEFGGIGDNQTDNKPAFDLAISNLKNQNGGTLTVPPGNYLVKGPIHLISNINLHIEEGARISFSSNPEHYLPVVKTSWEGTFLYNYSPFIYALECENIAITGKGIIDGEASETWNTWKSKQKESQMLSREMNHNSTPIEERIFGEGHYLRPQLIQFFNCKNIKVEGIRIEDSPFWCLHLLRCENVIVRGISYDAHNKNNDGIDPELSKNILIEDVTFNNADDNIAIKAGRDDDGRASAVCSENIVIRNCHFRGLHAIVVGSEMSAGVRNVYVENCDFAGKLKRGIYLKSNPDRGGFMNNIHINTVSFGEVVDCIYITSYYKNEGEGHVTDISEIYMENITCKKATDNGIVIQGFPQKKVKDIYFTNVQIDSVGNPLSMKATENIVMQDVTIGRLATAPSSAK